jgi:uncharacterized protein (DUF433 family)
MAKTKVKTKVEGYIQRRPGVRRGAPVIAGTGIKVLDVAVRYEVMGLTAEEIVAVYPQLSLAQVHAALAYYYEHKAEIDKEWKASVRRVATIKKKQSSILEQKLGQAKNLRR